MYDNFLHWKFTLLFPSFSPFNFQMLSEVGFQANQHELLAEHFAKERYKAVQEEVKRLKEQRKKNIKEAEKIEAELKKAFKTMDAAKEKFRKAFDEQEKSNNTYNKAENDGTVTKNKVNKLKLLVRGKKVS